MKFMKCLECLLKGIWIICVSVPAADYIVNHTNMPDGWTTIIYLLFLISCGKIINSLD